jgi:hypothetical protein
VEGREAIHAAFAEFTAVLNGYKGVAVDMETSGVVSGGVFTCRRRGLPTSGISRT